MEGAGFSKQTNIQTNKNNYGKSWTKEQKTGETMSAVWIKRADLNDTLTSSGERSISIIHLSKSPSSYCQKYKIV